VLLVVRRALLALADEAVGERERRLPVAEDPAVCAQDAVLETDLRSQAESHCRLTRSLERLHRLRHVSELELEDAEVVVGGARLLGIDAARKLGRFAQDLEAAQVV